MPASFLLALALAALLTPASRPASPLRSQAPARVECREWRACLQLALEAQTREDFETFHDLAWRAVQTGPRADPDLMYLLARAQSLSGRPHDALVMLQRLADMGVAPDAATNDDFRRVRALPGWPAVEATIERAGGAAAEAVPTARRAPAPAPASPVPEPAPVPAAPVPAPAAPAPPPPATAPLPTAPSTSVTAVEPEAPADAMVVVDGPVEEAARFSTEPFAPGGLAYDAVSHRFVFGDLEARRLRIVAEGMQHTVNLVGAPSAGFHDVMAIEIDPRRGDLWVASASPEGAGALHKLQLVSGRPLATFEAPAALEPLRLVDVAVTAAGRVLALDRAGRRILGLEAGGATLDVLMPVDIEAPASLAPAGDLVAYVAHRDGVARIDLRARITLPLVAPAGLAMGGFEWIRRYRDSLVGVQRLDDGTRRVVRLTLGAGGRVVTAGTVINASIPASAGPTCATISGDDLYYLVRRPSNGTAGQESVTGAPVEVIVERIRLR